MALAPHRNGCSLGCALEVWGWESCSRAPAALSQATVSTKNRGAVEETRNHPRPASWWIQTFLTGISHRLFPKKAKPGPLTSLQPPPGFVMRFLSSHPRRFSHQSHSSSTQPSKASSVPGLTAPGWTCAQKKGTDEAHFIYGCTRKTSAIKHPKSWHLELQHFSSARRQEPSSRWSLTSAVTTTFWLCSVMLLQIMRCAQCGSCAKDAPGDARRFAAAHLGLAETQPTSPPGAEDAKHQGETSAPAPARRAQLCCLLSKWHAVLSCAAYSASGDLQALNECLQSKYVCNSPTEQGEGKYMGYIKESLEVTAAPTHGTRAAQPNLHRYRDMERQKRYFAQSEKALIQELPNLALTLAEGTGQHTAPTPGTPQGWLRGAQGMQTLPGTGGTPACSCLMCHIGHTLV
ncbi:hypothetical protein Anapl_08258 [Anas platyrhynchos]|uniref:Uncharacterized protein n=1 Tax=Anas platyrhynchos TaxID=8839 RepID=R0KMG4_ANAPL|nr:hypothetical protein Anapl_08258 [Anas platyrhynchos]